jgi:hypothetical protein
MPLTPLNSAKLAHIVVNRVAMRQGRLITVAAVYRTAYGGRQPQALGLLLRQVDSADVLVRDQTEKMINEYLAELPVEVDPRPIAYLALTGGALDDASVAAAIKLEIISYRQVGIALDRWLLELRRMR